jgi:hypothetical protein
MYTSDMLNIFTLGPDPLQLAHYVATHVTDSLSSAVCPLLI